jgi:anti-anti-sigma factor
MHEPGSEQYSDVARHPENTTSPEVVIVRVEGGLFFANAESAANTIRSVGAAPGVRAVVLDAESIPFVDISAVNALSDTSQELEASGGRLIIAHDIGQVRDLFEVAGGPAPRRRRLSDGASCGRRRVLTGRTPDLWRLDTLGGHVQCLLRARRRGGPGRQVGTGPHHTGR